MFEAQYEVSLKDILKSADKIIKFLSDRDYLKKRSFQHFVADEMLSDAVIRNLEIIGEAAKNVPARLRRKYKQIEWKKIAGLRDTSFTDILGWTTRLSGIS